MNQQQQLSGQNTDSDLLARIYQSAALPQKPGAQQNGPEFTDSKQRPTSFNQPLTGHKNFASDPLQGLKDNRNNIQTGKHPVNYHQHMQNQFQPQRSQNNNVAADFYNNNMKLKDSNEEAADLRHQEVAHLTANVLSEAGISEEKLSSLTVEQQQQVIKIVQQRFLQLQREKQLRKGQKAQIEAMRGENAQKGSDDFNKKTSQDSGNIYFKPLK